MVWIFYHLQVHIKHRQIRQAFNDSGVPINGSHDEIKKICFEYFKYIFLILMLA